MEVLSPVKKITREFPKITEQGMEDLRHRIGVPVVGVRGPLELTVTGESERSAAGIRA